jgi:hypothetical protein
VIPAARSGTENARRRSGSALITKRCREGMLRKVLARRRSAIRTAEPPRLKAKRPLSRG